MMNTKDAFKLISKIKNDLSKLTRKEKIYMDTYIQVKTYKFNENSLDRFLNVTLLISYKHLIAKQNKNKLSLNEYILLNHIDRLDDLAVTSFNLTESVCKGID